MHVSEQLKYVIDSTVDVVKQFIRQEDFDGPGMECQTMVLDTCENILSSGNKFVVDCMNSTKPVEMDDIKTHCIQDFALKVEKRVNRMGKRLTDCLEKVDLAVDVDGEAQIMTKFKQSIVVALNKEKQL